MTARRLPARARPVRRRIARRGMPLTLWIAAAFASVCLCSLASAAPRYDTGAGDGEIKIGQTMAYSGPASAYGTIGRAEAAYFDQINSEGGVNGRKIALISVDDGYSPPRTVEQTRRLLEQEGVLLFFSSLGTDPNVAVHAYLNARRVPQLFIASTGMQWNDPKHFPWTMALAPNQKVNLSHEVQYLLEHRAQAKIAVLYENTDFGRDYLAVLKELLSERAREMIVAEASYETSDPTVDTQVIALQASGADTFFNFSTPKFAAQSIRKIYDLGWRPIHFLSSAVSSIATVLQPAGLEKSVGLISVAYWKDPTDPLWRDDPAVRDYLAWMARFYPSGDVNEIQNVFGYSAAQLLVHVLRKCGDDLTRENVMRQAASLEHVDLPMLLPPIAINTRADDYLPIKEMLMVRFDGRKWVRFP